MGKKISKIIPKEIKPAVPYIAAYFGGPMLASQFSMNPVFAKALSASLASKIQGDDTKTALKSGIFAAAPDVISGGLQKAGATLAPQTTEALKKTLTMSNVGSNAVPVSQQIGSILSSAGKSLSSTGYTPGNAINFKDAAKVIGTQTVSDIGARTAALNEKALRDYEAQLREQGIMDSAERRNSIFSYFSRAGYADDEINSMLDKYGYAYGGRVGYKEGGGIQALIDYLKEKEDEEDEFNLSNFSTGLEGIKSGYEIATGQPLMGLKPQPTRFGLANGGIPNVMSMRKTIAELIASGVIDEEDVEEAVAQIKNQAMMSMRAPGMADGGLMSLKAGGMPAEMDMRGGGFVPIGKQRRADDVPARLSKDEFVLTAKAVDGVGKATTGNAKDGAKIMYDFMNKYEALA
jgi:hypothetical protein